MIDLRLALRSLHEWLKRIADAAERQFPGVATTGYREGRGVAPSG
jgi:hypothetical protein